MSEDRVLRTVIEFLIKNGDLTEKALRDLQGVVQSLDGDTGELSESFEQLDKAIGKAGKGGVKQLRAELTALQKDFRKLAREGLKKGEDPIAFALANTDQSQIDRARQLRATLNADIVRDADRSEKAAQQQAAAAARQQAALERQAAAAQRVAQAKKQASAATQEFSSNLPRLRYALFDVSQTLTIAGAALTAISAISLKTAIDYERAFVDVIRTTETTGAAVGVLREQFNELASTLPLSFRELAQIGTLAGQLNVPTEDIQEFTSLVAKFAATTDVSIEASATAFGRLSELLDIPGEKLENLGSAILGVGINSVATESSIIAITTQLAGIANQAGLSADELIGLSSALASVGIQPELARGTITRLFGQISRAVSAGGESLENFGRVSGLSAQEFASGWQSAPIDTLLSFFDGIAARGGDAEAALRELGITSVRDVPAILRLAQTADTILKPALEVASDEFANGTALADQYGLIAETTAEKLRVLANNFGLLLEQLGQAGIVFKGVIDFATQVLRVLTDIASNPVGASILQLTTIVGLLGGALLLTGGLAARTLGGILALRTAMNEAGISSVSAAGGVRGLTTALGQFVATGRAASSTAGATAAGIGLIGPAAQRAALGIGSTNTAFAGAAITAGRFSGVLGALGGPAGIILTVASFALPSLIQSLSGYSDAVEIAADGTVNFEKALADIGGRYDWADLFDFGAAEQAGMAFGGPVGAVIAGAIADGIRGEGERVNAAITDLGRQAITSESFGGFLSGALGSVIGDGINEVYRQQFAALDQALVQTFSADKLEGIRQFNELMAQVRDAGGDVSAAYANLPGIVNEIANSDFGEITAQQAQQAALDVEELANAMRALVDDVFFTVNAEAELSGALDRLGEKFIEVGATSAFTSSEFQNVISTIIEQSGGAQTAANNLEGLFQALVAGGAASVGQLDLLRQVINGLLGQVGGGARATATNFDLSSFVGGANRASQAAAAAAEAASKRAARAAGGAARAAAKEMRTLLDYARDLQGVFSRAFDLRFGNQNAQDAVTTGWREIAEATQNASERIQDFRRDIQELQAQLQGLTADRAVQEYFLSVASAYGDELRAGVIRGNIAKIDSDIAKARADLAERSEDLADAQQDASKQLVGNSKAAIANRKTVQDMVKAYQEQVQTAAANGASQAELEAMSRRLRDEFVRQATQAGFSRQQIETYARSFDDMALAIQRVPRNITVNANTNPALQALNEFIAAAESRRANVPIGSSGAGSAGWAAGDAYGKNFNDAFRRALIPLNAFTSQGNQLYQVPGTQLRLYSSGGFTGRGGKYEPAGVVHKGEYVIPKSGVNQSTGLPYADALGRTQVGSRPANGGYSRGGFVAGGGAMMVELSPTDRRLLAQAAMNPDVVVAVDSKEIARASANGAKQITATGGRLS